MTQRTRREFFIDSLLAAAAAAVAGTGRSPALSPVVDRRRASPSDVIRVGVVGVRGRGRAHVLAYREQQDAEVVAICDADEGVISGAMKAAPDAKYVRDFRKLLEDDSIDVISIASPNHWHALMAVWAIQAGKHVYVEKPIGHDVFEGRKVVEAARKHGKVVQHGTQARSSKATIEAMEWLRGGGLGKVELAVGLCYKPRASIGKVAGPQQPPATCDYDLWTGPAEMRPLMREHLHYDWHWDFNTGNGDVGNQGVHQMDIARWGLGRDDLPAAVTSCGGRLGYDDDGNTPNTLISSFDYGDQHLIFEVRGLKTDPYRGARIGVVFQCEHGYLVSASYEKVVAFDEQGKQVKVFEGGGNHFRNFLDAVKAGTPPASTPRASKAIGPRRCATSPTSPTWWANRSSSTRTTRRSATSSLRTTRSAASATTWSRTASPPIGPRCRWARASSSTRRRSASSATTWRRRTRC